jgi:hypothetical protein
MSRRGTFPVLVRLTARGAVELGDRKSRQAEPPSAPPEPQPTDADEWWTKPYKGGPMVEVPGFPRPLYPPDVPASSGHKPSGKGPDVIAYKRTICRLGRWAPWDPSKWDDAYSNAFAHGRGTGNVGDTGVEGVQRQQSIDPASGWLGSKMFNTLRSARVPSGPHEGEMAMDSVAVGLIEDAWKMFAGKPDDVPSATIDDVRAAITDYCVTSIQAASRWHYEQVRPMDYGVDPGVTHPDDDCSEHATCSLYWAKKTTGVAVPDPNASGWNGYGYTGTLVNNPRCSAPYKVGDMAIYGTSTGDTEHVVTCYEPGDASSAEWCSNGSESAPYAVELHYRGDLLCVVRPALMPA